MSGASLTLLLLYTPVWAKAPAKPGPPVKPGIEAQCDLKLNFLTTTPNGEPLVFINGNGEQEIRVRAKNVGHAKCSPVDLRLVAFPPNSRQAFLVGGKIGLNQLKPGKAVTVVWVLTPVDSGTYKFRVKTPPAYKDANNSNHRPTVKLKIVHVIEG